MTKMALLSEMAQSTIVRTDRLCRGAISPKLAKMTISQNTRTL